MAFQQFHISDTNPNDTAGGGGCVCDPRKCQDCKGPFVVIPGNDMDFYLSPHVVIGSQCVDAFFKALHGGKEVLSIGERGDVVEAEEPQHREREESIVVESLPIDDAPDI